MTVDQALQLLKERKASLRCREVVQLLTDLGFEVRDAASGGHKVVTHPRLQELHKWPGTNFNCGHNPNHEVRSSYIGKLRRVIEDYREDLTTA